MEPATCLLVPIEELAASVSILRVLAGASVEPDSASPRRRHQAAARQTSDFALPRQSSIQDLEAQRSELMLKLEAAKLLAKKDELEDRVRTMVRNGSTDNVARKESESRVELARPRSAALGRSRADLPRMGSANIGLTSSGQGSAAGREGETGKAETASRGLRVLEGDDQERSPPKLAAMPRSHSESDVQNKEAVFDNLQKEMARLELELRQKIQQKNLHPAVQATQVESCVSGIRSSIHPSLRGVIPLPHPREVERDSRRIDPEFLAQLAMHRTKWGPVWVSSHYFNHRVYKRNMPKRGIPIDTSGDGSVDSLAYDTNGDGKVDLIITDDHSKQVAKVKLQHHILARARSLQDTAKTS